MIMVILKPLYKITEVGSTTPKKQAEMRHRAHPTKTTPDFKTKYHNTTKSTPNLLAQSLNYGSHSRGT